MEEEKVDQVDREYKKISAICDAICVAFSVGIIALFLTKKKK